MAKIINCGLCGRLFKQIHSGQKYCGSYKTDKLSCSFKIRRSKQNEWSKKQGWYISSKSFRKLKILFRDDWKCQKCGLKNDNGAFFDIDHKDGNRNNNTLANLWTLCPSCHRRKTIDNLENIPRKYRQQYTDNKYPNRWFLKQTQNASSTKPH